MTHGPPNPDRPNRTPPADPSRVHQIALGPKAVCLRLCPEKPRSGKATQPAAGTKLPECSSGPSPARDFPMPDKRKVRGL
jgi:hypothetical protein